MSRITANLGENKSGKYLVAVDFTFDELTEVRKAVHAELKMQNAIKRNKALTATEHEEAGRRSQLLQNALKGFYEAHTKIKYATNKRQEGRWLKAQEAQL